MAGQLPTRHAQGELSSSTNMDATEWSGFGQPQSSERDHRQGPDAPSASDRAARQPRPATNLVRDDLLPLRAKTPPEPRLAQPRANTPGRRAFASVANLTRARDDPASALPVRVVHTRAIRRPAPRRPAKPAHPPHQGRNRNQDPGEQAVASLEARSPAASPSRPPTRLRTHRPTPQSSNPRASVARFSDHGRGTPIRLTHVRQVPRRPLRRGTRVARPRSTSGRRGRVLRPRLRRQQWRGCWRCASRRVPAPRRIARGHELARRCRPYPHSADPPARSCRPGTPVARA